MARPLANKLSVTAGVDISHRGGGPGFVRVEGNGLTIPDFQGNRYYNTLGNLLGEPRASLLFIDFETGDLLQLQGMVTIDWSAAATKFVEGAERLWHFEIVRGWRRHAASSWSFSTRLSRFTSFIGRSTDGKAIAKGSSVGLYPLVPVLVVVILVASRRHP